MPLTKRQRKALESRMVPDIKRATKLEQIMKMLGFHKRASGRAVLASKGKRPLQQKGEDKTGVMVLKPPPSTSHYYPEYSSPFR